MRAMILALATLSPALAQAETGRWSLIAESGGCEVSFLPEAVDDGIFFVDRGEADCGPDIGRVTGYALNDDGATVVLYSTLDGVDLVGQLARSEDGVFTGKLRSGGALRLEHRSGPRGITDPGTGLLTGEVPVVVEDDPEAEADEPLAAITPDACLTYAGGNGGCVDQADLGPPDGGALQVITRMNMRDQGTTQGSTVVARIEAGACLQAGFCSEDGDGRLWCGVSGPMGQGFILKQDATTVYARNSCR